MTKKEFIKKIKADGLVVEKHSTFHKETFATKKVWKEYISISPDFKVLAPGIAFFHTEIKVTSLTESFWTKTNAEFIGDKLKPYRRFWKKEFTAWKRGLPTVKKQMIKFYKTTKESGLDGNLKVRDFVYKKNDLKKYRATGSHLGVVSRIIVTTYARSCKWGPSSRTDTFLVGRNENGNPFHHQIHRDILTIESALNWIWNGANIEQRHGDIGIATCPLKKVVGEEKEIAIPGAWSHKIKGEVRQNGSLYARNAFLFHEKEQHPFAYIGPDWKRIVVGRHSERNMSSAD